MSSCLLRGARNWPVKSGLPSQPKSKRRGAHFVTQVATMSQIAGELMIANMSDLQT
jgi:hypothetical protein